MLWRTMYIPIQSWKIQQPNKNTGALFDRKAPPDVFLLYTAEKFLKILDYGVIILYNVMDYGILYLGIPKSPLSRLGRLFCPNNAFQKVHNTRKYSELFETFVMTKSLAPRIKTELSEMPYERI